jgi:elongation factor P
MKITTSKVTKWTILQLDWWLYKVIDMSHTHTWRWGATDTFKVKEITTWKVKTVSYNAWAVLEQADVQTKNWIFLYEAWWMYSFMENDSWEIFELPQEDVEDIALYLKENLDVYLVKHEWKILSIILPTTIEYTIKSTVPGVKWNRAQSWTKPATLETWLEVQVPLHKNEWDTVVVNTITGNVS